MIRGRKEGSNYATWFIGFDHDEAFGLSSFTELPSQPTSTPASSRPSLRATSLESILPTSPSPRTPLPRSVTPAGTQTHAERQQGQPIATQTSLEVGESSAQTSAEDRLRSFASTGTETTGLEPVTKKTAETATQQTSPLEEHQRGFPIENGNHRDSDGRGRTPSSLSPHGSLVSPEPRSERVISTTDVGNDTPDLVDGLKRSRTNSGGEGARPRSGDLNSLRNFRNQRRKDRETKGLYKEAFDGAKRAEEFKFRVRFDQFLGDLHLALDERSPQGLPASFASPSYGEVMLTFREKVKDLLKGFTHRLQLAHESFGNAESPDDTTQKVKQDVSKFIEDLIGETLDLTSDEAVSDLSSLSDESSPDSHPTFEDLLAQAVVTKLLENHRKAVRDSLDINNDNSHLNHYNNNGNYNGSFDQLDRQYPNQNFNQGTRNYNHSRNFISLDQDFVYGDTDNNRNFQSADDNSRDFRSSTGDLRGGHPSRSQHPRDVFGQNRQVSVTSVQTDHSLKATGGGSPYTRTLSNQNILNTSASQDNLLVPQSRLSSDEDEEGEEQEQRSEGADSNSRSRNNSASSGYHNKTGRQHSSPSTSSVEPDNASRDHNHSSTEGQYQQTEGGEEEIKDPQRALSPADPERDFTELKDFVRRAQQQARPKLEARVLEEVAEQVEVQEEEFLPTSVDRDEERQQFHARYSVFDRVHNSEPTLPDFSQFENIDFSSSEIDPDLLSMNLAIIPEETEEELEQEEEDDEGDEGHGKWRNNWIFKGSKGVSVYDNLGKKKVGRFDQDGGPIIMMVPRPEDDFVPKVGNRDVDQLSDFSEGDLLTRSDLDHTDEEDDDNDDDDDEENSFYANTSKELARIAGRRLRSSRESRAGGKRREDKPFSGYGDRDFTDPDYDSHPDYALQDIPGPIVQPARPEVKLLYDLIPAEGDDPKFLAAPESVTIQEGEPVQFSCRVTGTQPFDVFWYREGDEVEELEEGEDVEMGNIGDKYWCTLYHVGRKQAGQYMCIALSERGKAIQYLVVTVKDNKQDLKKPEFLKGLKDVEVTEGQSVKYRVKVKGYPQPRVTWFKDGQILKASRSCRIEKFGNRDYILTIDYATMDDDAEYMVSARNVAGTEKLSAQVIVEPRSELPPRRQIMSSLPTSAASDSDSDISGIYNKRRSYNVANSKTPATSSPLLLSARRATSPSPSLEPHHQQQQAQTPSKAQLPSPIKTAQEDTLLSSQSEDIVASLPLSLTATPASPTVAMLERENELHLNHLDRKVTLTQKRVEEEAHKMEEDTKKDKPSANDDKGETTREPVSSARDMLAVAEEIIRLESAGPDSSAAALTSAGSSDPKDVTNSGGGDAGQVLDLDLLDELDDFPLPGLDTKPKATPVKSTFTMSLGGKDSGKGDTMKDKDGESDNGNGGPQNKPTSHQSLKPDAGVSQANASSDFIRNGNGSSSSSNNAVASASPVYQHQHHNVPPPTTTTLNLNNLSFDSGQGGSLVGGENSASLASSVSSSTSSLGGAAGEGDEVLLPSRVKGRYARDFDVTLQQQQQQKKKWSVNLDPFSPQAEVINKQGSSSSAQAKVPEVEIQVNDLSTSGPPPPQPAILSQPPARVRNPPVHMVGTTSEAEVPESRTEFNTDGNVELPSVNRLKALFSGQQDDMLGDGNFKRVPKHEEVHSITARSLSKQQMEKLRESNQKLSSLPPSIASSLPSTSTTANLQVPGNDAPESSSPSLSSTSPHKLSAATSIQHSSSPSSSSSSSPLSSSSLPSSTPATTSSISKVTLRPVSASSPQQVQQQEGGKEKNQQRRRSQIEEGSYVDVDDGKDPVLIYPETDPEYWKRQQMLLRERQQQQQQQQQKEQEEKEQQQHQHSQLQLQASHKSTPAPLPPSSPTSPSSPSAVYSVKAASLKPGLGKSPRLVVRRATTDIDLDALEASGTAGGVSGATGGGPRIKAGCISARAAFWEKKMMEGGEMVDEEEFPEMVEESDS